MRSLSPEFANNLKNGFLSPLVKLVSDDADLDFQIRDDYINIYFKGNSILKLYDNYKYEIHQKFTNGCTLLNKMTTPGKFTGEMEVNNYVKSVPLLKANVSSVKSRKASIEIEYEQLIIRSNNYNKTVNSEIYVTDRQFASVINKTRFDLSGVLWKREGRKKNQEIPLAFIEVKYSLNTDIKELDDQITRYYDTVNSLSSQIAGEAECQLHMKAELGLIKQSKDQIEALKTLKVSADINKAIFIIALIDYNPNSSLFNLKKLQALPFKDQIKIFHCRFAMWNKKDILQPI